MRIRKAVITAAGPKQRTLPLQTLIDRDGEEKSVLRILVEEVVKAKIEGGEVKAPQKERKTGGHGYRRPTTALASWKRASGRTWASWKTILAPPA